MQTLQVTNGDIVLSNGEFAMVTGSAKVVQDIQIATLTPYGSDRFHPRFGSVFSNFIGSPVNGTTVSQIQSEWTRVINNYQRVQLWKVQQAALANVASPFSQGELVQSIGPINVTQNLDTFQVTGSVNTTSGQQVNISTQVSS